MKNLKLLAFIGIVSTFTVACSKKVEVNLDLPDAAKYKKVYMPQAAYNPLRQAVSIVEKDTVFVYSAFIGGPAAATTDIPVNFTVKPEKLVEFNDQNLSSYQLMPVGSYELEATKAVIKSGTQSTGRLNLKIKTKGFLSPFETYLLPITVSKEGEEGILNETLATTYYLFTGAYAQGDVPREKAYSFGPGAGTIFTNYYGNDIVRLNPTNGDLLRYPADPSGQYGAPKVIGVGFNIFNTIFFYGGNRLIGRRIDNGNIFSYTFSPNDAIGANGQIGSGWNIFTKIIPFKGALLGINNAGAMTLYPLNANGQFGGSKAAGAGTNWNNFVHIIPYENTLLAIEADGTMWQYPFSDDGVAGSRIRVGTGWNMYKLVFASGTDLLGLDENGDLWRYKFNPNGFWPL